ncbi:uncharacterized protein LOC126996101 isoform X8 [Eriocheir sinensis]|uniref:uncharacterized protein LOC126996101 isoform X8 n=2 Tax=Eriocheir sinensis TaxID=95602 RepID=UPI0021C84A32|nr:uncharacterized protein LOC126996101 isoform X8 [Eriocheir sinensis]
MAPLPPPSGKADEPSWGENCRATLASRGAVYKRPGGGSQYSRSWSLHLVDMKIAAVATVLVGFCLLAVSAEPVAEAEPGFGYGHHTHYYRPSYGHGGHYLGKRSADPVAEAEPGFGYGHHTHYYRPSYGHGGHYLGKRSAEPEAEAEPGFGYRHNSYYRPSYGYGYGR